MMMYKSCWMTKFFQYFNLYILFIYTALLSWFCSSLKLFEEDYFIVTSSCCISEVWSCQILFISFKYGGTMSAAARILLWLFVVHPMEGSQRQRKRVEWEHRGEGVVWWTGGALWSDIQLLSTLAPQWCFPRVCMEADAHKHFQSPSLCFIIRTFCRIHTQFRLLGD